MACNRSWLVQNSGYRQVTSYTYKHRTAHAKRGMNLPSACSLVYENWWYSSFGEQELKAQYFKYQIMSNV